MDTQHRSEWDVVVEPSHGWWRIDLRELWHYRDLLVLMVKRDLLAVYKQTILGPLWQVVQPLLTSVVLAVIFGMLARMAPAEHPPVLFYLALVVAALTAQVSSLVLGLAWTYVAARVLHSAIHCSYNKVMHRFRAYAFSAFVLLALWCVLGYGLIAG